MIFINFIRPDEVSNVMIAKRAAETWHNYAIFITKIKLYETAIQNESIGTEPTSLLDSR